MFALTIESGQGWALIIAAIFQGLGLLYAARQAKRGAVHSAAAATSSAAAAKNSDDVKQQTAAAASTLVSEAASTNKQLERIHTQAEKIGADTNGNLSALRQELTDYKTALATRDTEIKSMREQIATLSALATPGGSAPNVIVTQSPPRPGRRNDPQSPPPPPPPEEKAEKA